MEEILAFSKEQTLQLEEYFKDEKIISILEKLGIYNKENSKEENIDFIEEYIYENLKGKYIGNRAIDDFFGSIGAYAKLDDFDRIYGDEYVPDGFINYNNLLPIKEEWKLRGFRCLGDVLGPDEKVYLVKEAEGLKSGVAGRKNRKDALYNPTIANAVFKFLGEECAEYIPACEKIPYYYILSENFLKPNQKMYEIDDEKYMEGMIQADENNNVSHNDVIKVIEETVIKKYGNKMPKQKLDEICNKLKLQYTTQETIKKLIKSMDENLRNTSIIITESDNGEISDINISPAYDLDLSFLLGEEMISGDCSNQMFYRTTRDGKTDLQSIVKEFNEIPGYKEKMQEFVQKFNGNYISQIFDIAFISSRIEAFKSDKIKEKFSGFIMRQVALFKEVCKEERDENQKNQK